MIWHAVAVRLLRASNLFTEVQLIGGKEKENLASHPHHFQERMPDGEWRFRESSFRGDIETEIPIVLNYIKEFLESTL